MLLINNKSFQWGLFTTVSAEMHAVGLVEGRAYMYRPVQSNAIQYNRPAMYISFVKLLKGD